MPVVIGLQATCEILALTIPVRYRHPWRTSATTGTDANFSPSQSGINHEHLPSTLEKCKATPYTFNNMIRSFRHKGLRALYQRGDTSGVRADHVPRLRRLLASLDVAKSAKDLDRPGNRLHALKGQLAGYWSVSVSGNWRVIFRFDGSDVELVDYLDYH